ncbi:DUF6285 domain-containing protein [Tsuneonella sp. HG249]
MQDDPPAGLLVAEARKALDAGLAPGFPQKVAANALGISQRELELGPSYADEELARLAELLGETGRIEDLNAQLVNTIRAGDAMRESDVTRHLILTTFAKLSIDQPGYRGFRALRGEL